MWQAIKDFFSPGKAFYDDQGRRTQPRSRDVLHFTDKDGRTYKSKPLPHGLRGVCDIRVTHDPCLLTLLGYDGVVITRLTATEVLSGAMQ